MTEFRGIKVVAVPEINVMECAGCVAEQFGSMPLCTENECLDRSVIFQPASLHDGRPHVVLTGGRKPSFPIKAVWFPTGERTDEAWRFDVIEWGDIIAVERAEKK